MNLSWRALALLVIVTLVLGILIGDRLAANLGEETGWSDSAPARKGYVTFNVLKTAYLGRRTQVTAILHGNYHAALDVLRDEFEDGVEGRTRIARIKQAKWMLAVLNGKYFEIEPIDPVEQRVVRGQATTWTWYVRPTEAGEGKRLRLQFFAIHREGRERLCRFYKWVNVRRAPEDLFPDWATVFNIAVGLATILGTILTFWTILLMRSQRPTS